MAVDTETVDSGTVPQFNIGVDTQLTDAEPFLGEVVTDAWERSEKADAGWQYHLAVKPLMYQIGGKTGAFHTYYNPSTAKKAKMGILLAGLKATCPDGFGPSKSKNIGEGHLIGTRLWFVRKDIDYGTDRTSGEQRVARDVLMPYKVPTAEELALIPDHEAGNAPAPKALEFTDDEVAALMAFLVGKTPADAVKAAVKDTTLDKAIKNAITGGSAVRYLKKTGKLTDTTGTLQAV